MKNDYLWLITAFEISSMYIEISLHVEISIYVDIYYAYKMVKGGENSLS